MAINISNFDVGVLSPILNQIGFSNQRDIQILDNDTGEVISTSINPLNVSVNESKTTTKFTVENGETRNDHIVDNAIEIQVEFLVVGETAGNVVADLRSRFRNNDLFTVQTRMNSYPDMLIESFPHDESQYIADGCYLNLTFTEWRETTPEYGELKQESVKDPEHSSTVKRGTQRGKEASEPIKEKTKRSTLDRILF